MRFNCALLLAAACGAKLATAFTKLTAQDVWDKMNPGWNSGNTLDGIPGETDWGNPAITKDLLSAIKSQGFNSIRIPITWYYHFDTYSPTFTINAAWLDRVETVVDWALDSGFYVVINSHHDSWTIFDLTQQTMLNMDWNTRMTMFEKLWTQVATRLSTKSEKLIFEALNEPAGSASQANAEQYNILNQNFVNVVRGSGGYNADRLITLSGLNMNIANTVSWFTVPTNAGNWMLQVHDYDPWFFVSNSDGQTFWGSADDKSAIEATFISLQDKFGVPALIGEWGPSEVGVENGAAWIYYDYMVRTARAYNLTTQFWDNGEHLSRTTFQWVDPVKRDIIINAAKGLPNTLPSNGQTQTVYIKSSETIAKTRTIALDLNGNKVTSVVNGAGATLRASTDYTATSTGITLSASYFSSKIPNTSVLGNKDTITVHSSSGPALPFPIVLYDKPTLTGSSAITVTNTGSNLNIPFNFKGTTLAGVKAVGVDGVTYLKDDWTVWLGPLQQAHLALNSDFSSTSSSVVLTASTLQLVQNFGQPVVFTFEFWPRTDTANAVNVTVTVA